MRTKAVIGPFCTPGGLLLETSERAAALPIMGFLLEASRLEDEIPCSGPGCLAGGTLWAGPWEVEPVTMSYGHVWAVIRKGGSLAAGGRAVAVSRHRSDALLIAATLPGLAMPNHLSLG